MRLPNGRPARATDPRSSFRVPHAHRRPRRREARRPHRRRRPTSTSPTSSTTSTRRSSAAAGSTASAPSWPSARPPGRCPRFAGERIGAPIARPHQILCIGLNYSDHAAETGQAVPDEPILFTKSPNTLDRPERRRTHPARVDQARLGGRARHRDRPAHQLPGLGRGGAATRSPATCSSTTSASARSRWSAAASGRKGKSAETFNPAGPWLVTPDEIDDVLALDMWLDVNGVRRQTGNTSDDDLRPVLHRALPEPVPGAGARRPDQHRHPARRRHGLHSRRSGCSPAT